MNKSFIGKIEVGGNIDEVGRKIERNYAHSVGRNVQTDGQIEFFVYVIPRKTGIFKDGFYHAFYHHAVEPYSVYIPFFFRYFNVRSKIRAFKHAGDSGSYAFDFFERKLFYKLNARKIDVKLFVVISDGERIVV